MSNNDTVERPANLITERGPDLPAAASCYREIGPFSVDTVPAGLFNLHRLKPGTWGVVSIPSGSIMFVWDDEAGGGRILKARDAMLVPPEVPHHLERIDAVSLAIGFWAVAL